MAEKKMQRVRSPNYPFYDLKECMDFLNKLAEKFGSGEAYFDDAVTQMGHSPTSSTANRVISSLLSFGLINSRGSGANRYVWLSQLSQKILIEEENSPQWVKLIQQAALKDNSMQNVWEKWENEIPQDETIIKVLQFELKYSPKGAKRFASVIIETYEYAKLKESSKKDTKEESQEFDEESSDDFDENDQNKKDLPASIRKANLLLPGHKREIVIYAPADLTDGEFDLILKWLELQKYGLVSKEKSNEG